jgi:hypothetical protein
VYCQRMTTAQLAPSTPITHRRHNLGTGMVVRPLGNTAVLVQWPGIPMARRESIEDVEVYVPAPPQPAVRRRRRTTR